MSNDKNEFITKDLYVASFLLLEGQQFLGINKSSPQRPMSAKPKPDKDHFLFFFTNCPQLIELVGKFYARQIRVEPMDFVVAMKQLKGKMYNFREGDAYETPTSS